ncbi:MAG: hypothetical protein A3K18_00345 [Lentisphaerae bacterium RIFOXYA12_64_32]|nr:MAG: hypothetical protein A3K18_00345 [Lentisphaerae bacterium RIFOXYA12_64_32]
MACPLHLFVRGLAFAGVPVQVDARALLGKNGGSEAMELGRDSSTLRVLQVTGANAGGVRMHLRHIVPGLCAQGIAVDLILSPRGTEPDFKADLDMYRDLGCRIGFCYMPRLPSLRHDPPAFMTIRRCLREWAPAVIHCHATKAGLLGRLAAATVPGVRAVYSPHAFCFEGFQGRLARTLGAWMEGVLATRTARLVLVSEAEKEQAVARARIDPARVRVIENGMPESALNGLRSRDEVRAEWGIAPETVAVGVPGRLAFQKGQDWLLRALRGVDMGSLGIHFFMCGVGPMEAELRQQAADWGLAPFLTWKGYVPALGRQFRAFDLILLPSRYEALSYVLLETLAAGVPAVVSDIPSHFPRREIRDLLRPVRFGDDTALIAAMKSFCTERGEWAAVGARGPALVHEHFRLERQVARLAECYREVAGGVREGVRVES